MLKPEHFGLVTTEIFGPFYVYTTYRDQDLPMGPSVLLRFLSCLVFSLLVWGMVLTLCLHSLYVNTHMRTKTVLQALEKMENHLTAAIVSNDVLFQQQVTNGFGLSLGLLTHTHTQVPHHTKHTEINLPLART